MYYTWKSCCWIKDIHLNLHADYLSVMKFIQTNTDTDNFTINVPRPTPPPSI